MKKYIAIFFLFILSIGIFYLQFQYQRTYQPHTYYQVYLDDAVIGTIDSKNELEEYISTQGTLIKNQVLEYQEELDILENMDSLISNKLKKYSVKDNYQEWKTTYDSFHQLVDDSGNFSQDKKSQITSLISNLPVDSYTILTSSIKNYASFLEALETSFIEEKKEIIDYIKQNQDSLSLSETEIYYLDTYQEKGLENISYVKQVYMQEYVSTNEIYLSAEDVYSPLGLSVEKVNTYYANISSVEDVYAEIIKEKPCTIEGYQFRIKKTDDVTIPQYVTVGAFLLEDTDTLMNTETEDVIIYVTDEDVFKEAVEKLEAVFAGTEEYEKYIKGTQDEIVDEGTRIEDIYVDEDITVKKTNISVGEKIYTSADELSSFLLYGENKSEKTVYASASDTVLSLTYEYGISVEEFFLSNPSFTSVNNIFYENQPVVIAQTNPQISIVVEEYKVEDLVVNYSTVEKYDSTLTQGTNVISQEGKNGLERVSQNVKSVNGTITFINPVSNVTLQKATDEIVLVGTKVVPHIGSTSSWYWPTKSGYRISSYFGYRTSPLTGKRELHSGLDIAGTGMGSPVYAANNGTIYSMKKDKYNYGTHIIIDHHNGYYTLYAHMSGFVSGLSEGSIVERGQQIGYVGSTGASTGPHLHFEIRTCPKYACVVNPLPYLEK